MRRSAPVRVDIPAIGVRSRLMGLGLQDDGTMEVPPGAFPAGWYTGAPTPGELGPAVLAGHVRWHGDVGVFADLGALRRGDEVRVSRADGSTAVFRVTGSEQFDKGAFPTERVYGDIDHAGLRLITCSGSDGRRYRANLVVLAQLEGSARTGRRVPPPVSPTSRRGSPPS
jgi:sortase (surface protein transpeptidase)